MEKEVGDIIQECIRPNFVELPEVIDRLPTPNMRGQYNPLDTDPEDMDSLTEADDDDDDDNEEEEEEEGTVKEVKGNEENETEQVMRNFFLFSFLRL